MLIRTKLVEIEVKNIDLSDVCELYQAEETTISEELEDGQVAELVATSTGAVTLIIHGKGGDVTAVTFNTPVEIVK